MAKKEDILKNINVLKIYISKLHKKPKAEASDGKLQAEYMVRIQEDK